MIEELYIIQDGERKRLDLNTPSGITLEYKSGIMCDLNAIQTSYSYTFKLPLTQNNRRIFENADDVRSMSSVVGKKLKSEYIRNGVPLLTDANLYVKSSDNESYECNFTWGELSGLKNLLEHDRSIRELSSVLTESEYDYIGDADDDYEKDKIVYIGDFDKYSDVDNNTKIIRTRHKAGVNIAEHVIDNDSHPAYPPPVVRVDYLVELIYRMYGITFNFGNDNMYKNLVIPLVKKSQSNALVKQNYISLSNPSLKCRNDGEMGFYTFDKVDNIPQNPIVATCYERTGAIGASDTIYYGAIISDSYEVLNPNKHKYWTDSKIGMGGYMTITRVSSKNVSAAAVFEIYMLKYSLDDNGSSVSEWELVHSQDCVSVSQKTVQTGGGVLDGTYEITTVYRIDFRESEGFAFNLISRPESNVRSQNINLKFVLKDSNGKTFDISHAEGTLRVYQAYDEYGVGMYTNVFANLPDISCGDLIKEIYSILGGIPIVNSDTSMGIMKYKQINNYITSGNILDLSGTMLANDSQGLKLGLTMSEVSNGSNYKANNYYLMANDKLDDYGTEYSESVMEDAYEHSYLNIHLDGAVESGYNIIFQSKFYGAFAQNAHFPRCNTYNTQDYYKISSTASSDRYDTRKYTVGEAKPMIANLIPQEGTDYCDITIWKFPSNIASDANYSIRNDIISNARILEINLLIDDIKLQQIDLNKPVYIEYFNSFFSIISLTANDDGVTQAVLIKIPYK